MASAGAGRVSVTEKNSNRGAGARTGVRAKRLPGVVGKPGQKNVSLGATFRGKRG